jgi:radical SAM superfamily enzyme YgiQ (UPF0313 family)
LFYYIKKGEFFMKITFIQPAVRSKIGNQLDFKYLSKLVNGVSKTGGVSIMGCISLALPTLAALTPGDAEMSIIDENIDFVDFDAKADIAAISYITLSSNRAYEIADEFRKRGVYVVLGGFHASMFPDEALMHGDSVFVGEAEDTWPGFIEDFKNKRPEKVYKSEKKPDLKKLVVPRWDLINNRYYNVRHVQTSRGCPFDCDFCLVRSMLGTPRQKPVENVLSEIKEVLKYNKTPGMKVVIFSDDNIIASPKYAKELFKALIPLKIRWNSQCSINIAEDDELLDLAAQSGCDSLLIGLESVSQESLNSVNKGKFNKADKYREAVEKIHSRKISICGMIILGLDSDDNTIFDKTLEFMNETSIIFPMFNILTPIPGTRLCDQFEKENRLLHHRWDEYNGSTVCMKPKLMSAEELQQGFYRVLQELYSKDAIFTRLNQLWEKGFIKMDNNYTFLRVVMTLVLFVESLRQKKEMSGFIRKCIKLMWRKKGINLNAILMNLNNYEYMLHLPRK